MTTICCIVSVSIWDSVYIHCNAIIFGLWVMLKDFLKWIWNPKAFANLEIRDNPPSCLVDSSLGQHSYVKLKGIKLHYVDSGSKDHTLVLLLHGFPDCWLSWRHQMSVLSKHFRVVALDLKGFGDSDKPPWRNVYRIDLIVSEIEQFVNALGVNSCIVIGHDLGAMLGWFLIHKSPDFVKKFVAISCPHPNIYWDHLNDNFTFNTKWVHMTQLPHLPEIDALKEDLKIINTTYSHLSPIKANNKDNAYIEAYKYTFSRKEDWTGPVNYYRNLPFARIDETLEHTVPVHTLLIMGNKDPAIQLEAIIKSTDYCEKFLVKIIDGTGHFPHQEKPDKCNEILLNFLITKTQSRTPEKKTLSIASSLKDGIMNRMIGAMNTTVKYGNNVIDGVVNSAPKTLFLANTQ